MVEPQEEKESCPAQQEEMRAILQDIKGLTREVTDYKQAQLLKKQIKEFSAEIEHYCDEKTTPASATPRPPSS